MSHSVQWAAYLAAFIYLLPVLVVWLVRAGETRDAWEFALDVPFALSVNLLAMLLLARILPLEAAAWTIRGLWLGLGFVYLLRRGDAPRRFLRRHQGLVRFLIYAALATYACVWLSTSLSRPWGMWDRAWQVPLVASVRGQTAPFVNVYQPDIPLYYHYTGVALAAALQVFSFDVIGASLALSLVHDVFFGLIGFTLAGLLYGGGVRRWHLYVLSALALLLNGPATAFRAVGPERGYAFLNYVQMSFRPYIAVAGLLFLGVVGAVFVRLERLRRAASPWRTLPCLAASFALLAITEEPSAALLGLGLGVAWLVNPDAVHPRRVVGVGILVALAAAIPLGARVFQTSLAAKDTVGAATLTDAARVPGFDLLPLPISTDLGWRVFWFEFTPVLGLCAALAVLTVAEVNRRTLALFALVAAPTAAALFAVTRLEINQHAGDAHRFMVLTSFLCPLVAILVLARREFSARLAPLLAIFAMAVGAHSTLGWVDGIWRNGADKIFGGEEMHDASCRALVGSKPWERPRPTYIARSVFWQFVGCRPSFVPGVGNALRVIKTEQPIIGPAAMHELEGSMVGPDASLRVVCPFRAPNEDAICAYAAAKAPCKRAGALALVCELSPEARAELHAPRP